MLIRYPRRMSHPATAGTLIRGIRPTFEPDSALQSKPALQEGVLQLQACVGSHRIAIIALNFKQWSMWKQRAPVVVRV